MTIADQKIVSIHYTLTNAGGETLDSSAQGDPLKYLHGAGNIIAGLESALVGKNKGDKLDVTVQPAEGYGEYNEGLKQEVPKSAFQGVETIEVGARFEAQSDQGGVSVVVTEVTDETVTVDGNHPLAGEELHFSVEVVEIQDPSEEELAHGHAH